MIYVIVDEKEEDIPGYPCLMISEKRTIVLFSAKGCGTAIQSDGNSYQVGKYSETWANENFKPFKGSVILSNNK